VQQPVKAAEAPPKKKKVRTVKRLPPGAAGAYARANFYQPIFNGF
jgi:hypothetical protein